MIFGVEDGFLQKTGGLPNRIFDPSFVFIQGLQLVDQKDEIAKQNEQSIAFH